MSNTYADPEDSQLVADAKNAPIEPVDHTYTEVWFLNFEAALFFMVTIC